MAKPKVGTRVAKVQSAVEAKASEGTVIGYEGETVDSLPEVFVVWDDGTCDYHFYDAPCCSYGYEESVTAVGLWNPVKIKTKDGSLSIARYADGVIIINGGGGEFEYSVIAYKEVPRLVGALMEYGGSNGEHSK